MNHGEPAEAQHQLDEIIAEYLQALESGQVVDEQAYLRRYPQFADDLQAFFRDHASFGQAIRPMLASDASPPPVSRGDGTTGVALSDESSDGILRTFGDYELLEEIGCGGMGIVYRARQISLNRIVALKVILAGQFASAQDVRRFQVDAQITANLDHPHIVPIYEIGQHEGFHFFTMRLIEGGSVEKRISHFKDDHRGAARLVATVARAVHHAHQHGIIHRDLKPGNILIDQHGQPVVTDFGLARHLEDDARLTMSGTPVGTPRYMSPEQARGDRAITLASDVYGLGATLYELLTGQAPFTSSSRDDVLREVREADPPRPSSVRPRTDRDLETICLKCLEKDPARRYASAEGMAQDLERWLRHEPIEARPAGVVRRSRQWVRRHPAVTSVVCVLILALLVVTWVMQRNYRLWRALGDLSEMLIEDERAHLDELWDVRGKVDRPPVVIRAEVRPSRGDLRRGTRTGLPVLRTSLGVYQRRPASQMLTELDAVLTELERKLTGSLHQDVRIDLIVYPETRQFTSYVNAREALLDRKVDFMRLGPNSYVEASRDPRGWGIELLARHRVQNPYGGIYARKDAGIGSIDQLRGKRLAFQDEESTTTVFAKALLASKGIHAQDLKERIYRTNAGEVNTALEQNVADAGAFNTTLIEGEDQRLQPIESGRFLLFGQLWVARSGLAQESPELVAAVKKALYALPPEVVQSMGNDIVGLVPVSRTDLQPVEKQVDAAKAFND